MQRDAQRDQTVSDKFERNKRENSPCSFSKARDCKAWTNRVSAVKAVRAKPDEKTESLFVARRGARPVFG
jgi:hypothetical protein